MRARKRVRVKPTEVGWTRSHNGRLCRTKGSTETTETCAELPLHCLEIIFSHLHQRRDVITAGAVCQAWHHASLTAPAWSKVDISWPDILSPIVIPERPLSFCKPISPRPVNLEAPYRPALEAAFVSFLVPRAAAIRSLCIARVGPVRNLDDTSRDGFADIDAICNLVAACTNLQHLEVNVRIAMPRGGSPELLLARTLETALEMCPCLTSLKLPIRLVTAFHPCKLSRVETLFVYPMFCGLAPLVELEEVISELPALKVLTISSQNSSARLPYFHSASVESFTIVGKTLLDEGFDFPNLREFHAEDYYMLYQVVEGLELYLPPRLRPALSNLNVEELEVHDGSVHLVA